MSNEPGSSSFDADGATRARDGVRPLDWARQAGAEDLVEWEMQASVRRKRRRRLGFAGAFALTLGLAGAFLWRGDEPLSPARVEVAASALASARQRLDDGSIVDLREGAEISVAFDGTKRSVTLRRGEAHFQVAKDPLRPFVVAVGEVEVRAIGTAFLVEFGQTRVDVVVSEGTVAVEAKAKGRFEGAAPVIVDAGEKVSIDRASGASAQPAAAAPVSASELAARLAWRVPQFEFNGTPLADVIARFNAHGPARLTLAEPELGRLELSGVLRADNVSVLLQILGSSYGVEAERTSSGEIILRRSR